jgi:hypothetical protein
MKSIYPGCLERAVRLSDGYPIEGVNSNDLVPQFGLREDFQGRVAGIEKLPCRALLEALERVPSTSVRVPRRELFAGWSRIKVEHKVRDEAEGFRWSVMV